MSVETSTVNVLLGCIIAFEVWIVTELYRLKIRVAILSARCRLCRHHEPGGDTTNIIKLSNQK